MPETSIPLHPYWVWELLAAVQQHENEHRKEDNPCFQNVLEKVPEHVRYIAQGILVSRGMTGAEE